MHANPWKLLEQYPAKVVEALAALSRKRAAPCYITGGTVRDWFLGRTSRDLDITVAEDAFGWSVAGALR